METITAASRAAAEARVKNSPALLPHAGWLLDDWDEEHKIWVATAPEEELIEWAQEQEEQRPEDE